MSNQWTRGNSNGSIKISHQKRSTRTRSFLFPWFPLIISYHPLVRTVLEHSQNISRTAGNEKTYSFSIFVLPIYLPKFIATARANNKKLNREKYATSATLAATETKVKLANEIFFSGRVDATVRVRAIVCPDSGHFDATTATGTDRARKLGWPNVQSDYDCAVSS